MTEIETHCGYVAIIGRPNVGKSTLLNALVGQKVSATCHKRQTTRHVISGIKTNDETQTQVVYVDTPGIHLQSKRALNRYMNRVARSAVSDVNLVLFIVSIEHWHKDDDAVLEQLKEVKVPVILVINKVDTTTDKAELMAKIQMLSEKMNFAEVVPVSAKKRHNIERLESIIERYMPLSPYLFSADQVTDRHDSFLISEVIREKLFRHVHQEVPYSATVMVDEIKHEKEILHIYATIIVEKAGQKAIIIGKEGEKLKKIGQESRIELERMYGQKIFLKLWVKVKEEWADDENAMKHLGFN